jgi:hypothetical protein
MWLRVSTSKIHGKGRHHILTRNAQRTVADDGFFAVVGGLLGVRHRLAGTISVGGKSRRRATTGVAYNALLRLDGISDKVWWKVGVGFGGGGATTLGRGGGGVASAIIAIVRGCRRRRGRIHNVASGISYSLPFGLACWKGRPEVLGSLARADAANALGGAVAALIAGEVNDAGESHEMVRPILINEAELPHARSKGDAIRLNVHDVVVGSLGLAVLGL